MNNPGVAEMLDIHPSIEARPEGSNGQRRPRRPAYGGRVMAAVRGLAARSTPSADERRARPVRRSTGIGP